ncbi:uncharacterized protein LOC124142586 isoform X1 [Haliotis rufescens]|uniref:uncharacterized protein LOC124142586 isoform X1 n=1 Tax=Haliotis rufescens TaxID=6454 RepID=UPI00201F6414|nr:uncharacterized protein LOC124142586 isoform X1 [Haliotis rufescens]XP_048254714.1 uncharacterized protein LOC124142586 isoform X1 [Haliotis rufescens]XP_048254715.1 uncharacterized protein LOC124142586 isoform X1 [Haliotis rufescens]
MKNMSQKVKKKHYYRQGDVVAIEEDATHEFKGHRNLAIEELPPWTKETKTSRASRRAVSRALNAFLNTGKGGTVYLGVIDDGTVLGLKLTLYQKDHVVSSVQDLFSRYHPPVPTHRYMVKFVPVLGESSTEEQVLRLISKSDSDYSDTSQRHRAHVFRSHHYCWCDKDAVAQINMGVLSPDYVIEITIKPWDPADPRSTDGVGTVVNLHPIHEDEEGNVYMRRQASVVKYTLNEIAQLTRQQVKEECEAEIRRLKKEISSLSCPTDAEDQNTSQRP